MTKSINRWTVLAASTAVLLCTGAIYAFSIFAGPLSAQTGWTMGEIMMAFTINSAVGPIPMILGGYFTDKGWAKWSIVIGGLLFGLGFFLTSFATSPAMLYVTYGLLAGIGQGFAYSGCLSNTIKLFPDKRGLASGIITGGMGAAAVIAAPVGNAIIQSQDAFAAYRYLGIAYMIVVAIAGFFIQVAPADYKPEGWNPPQLAAGTKPVNKNWKEMLATPIFYVIFALLFVGAFSGLMIASNASTIGQAMFGLTPAIAATYVSMYSFSNSLGRVIWGTVSDKLGRNNTIYIILGVVAVAFAFILTMDSKVGFLVGVILLGLCFGGIMGVFPPIVMENYGPINQGVNYGIVFCGYSLAAFFAPKVAISMQEGSSFAKAFYVAIVLAIVGLALNFVYVQLKKGKAAKAAKAALVGE